MEAFWSKVARGNPDECWEWQGSRTGKGYGRFHQNGGEVGAHRFAWELANGQPIPPGLNVCHSCDNPGCVNPSHLRVDTQSGNIRERDAKRRGRNSRKDACPAGHKYTPENTFITPTGARDCKECNRLDMQKRYQDPAFRDAKLEYLKEWRSRPFEGERTTCTKGHELTPENSYVKPNGYRECRTCALEARRAREAVKRPRTGPDRTHCQAQHELNEQTAYRKADGSLECRICAAAAARARRARRTSLGPTLDHFADNT